MEGWGGGGVSFRSWIEPLTQKRPWYLISLRLSAAELLNPQPWRLPLCHPQGAQWLREGGKKSESLLHLTVQLWSSSHKHTESYLLHLSRDLKKPSQEVNAAFFPQLIISNKKPYRNVCIECVFLKILLFFPIFPLVSLSFCTHAFSSRGKQILSPVHPFREGCGKAESRRLALLFRPTLIIQKRVSLPVGL